MATSLPGSPSEFPVAMKMVWVKLEMGHKVAKEES